MSHSTSQRRRTSYDSLHWNAILNAEQHREAVRVRLENAAAASALRAKARERLERVFRRATDEAWNKTLERYHGAPLEEIR